MSGDIIYKLLVLGDEKVGKTQMIEQYVRGKFSEVHLPTDGVVEEGNSKVVSLDGQRVKLLIWDTAGNEEYRQITSSFFRGSHGMLVVYDVTSEKSFKHVQGYLHEIEQNASESAFVVLVGAKTDMEAERKVTTEQVEEYVKKQKFIDAANILTAETSAKTNTGITEAFDKLATGINQIFKAQQSKESTSGGASSSSSGDTGGGAKVKDPEDSGGCKCTVM